jgi:AraC-like DNA-binding protein
MVDEHLVFLLHDLTVVHKIEGNRAKHVSAVKASTRKEIYKRLCVAKDLLHSSFMSKPDLALMSKTAFLSTPQLIRKFRAVFQTTPHQYLNQIRLAHAKELLKVSDLPVNEIALGCGFENTSAFCRSFKKEFGVPPLYFRSAR